MMKDEMEPGHSITIEDSSNYFPNLTLVYCLQTDETKPIIGVKHVHNCPMCGEEIWKQLDQIKP